MIALKGKTVLVGISGGIAAYKVCTLVSRLVQSGATVHVAMTKNATEFVAPLTFESLSRNRVVVDTFDRNFTWEVEHVSLAKKADMAVIAPATANVIAKLAQGIADDFLTTTLLACKCPKLVAPAMNCNMMEDAATKSNLAILAERGYDIIEGSAGYLACGDKGVGRMAEPDEILERIADILMPKPDLVGKTVMITTGSTRADIDPVRFITNRSSGKMGYALAEAAFSRGADVIYVCGHTDKFDIPAEWVVEKVDSTADMLSAVQKHCSAADIIVAAAAPCDYEIVPADHKIKSDTLRLELKKAPDCAAWLGEHKSKKTKLVIFAAETDDGEQNARKKLAAKKADMVVLNDVTRPGAGFGTDTNIATLITADSCERLDIMQKRELADIIFDRINKL